MTAGFIETSTSINRNVTCSSVVFQGVRPGEDPRLTTMWVILGEPVCSVAFLAELDSSRHQFLCRGADPLRPQTYFLVAVDREGRGGFPAVIYRFDLS